MSVSLHEDRDSGEGSGQQADAGQRRLGSAKGGYGTMGLGTLPEKGCVWLLPRTGGGPPRVPPPLANVGSPNFSRRDMGPNGLPIAEGCWHTGWWSAQRRVHHTQLATGDCYLPGIGPCHLGSRPSSSVSRSTRPINLECTQWHGRAPPTQGSLHGSIQVRLWRTFEDHPSLSPLHSVSC